MLLKSGMLFVVDMVWEGSGGGVPGVLCDGSNMLRVLSQSCYGCNACMHMCSYCEADRFGNECIMDDFALQGITSCVYHPLAFTHAAAQIVANEIWQACQNP